MMNEPNHPGMRADTHDHTLAWSAMVDAADAIVVVTPEYNHGLPASLKNSFDYLFHEWGNKALGLVSYGGVSGGIRSAGMIKQVAAALHLFPVVAQVILPFSATHLHDGVFAPGDAADDAARATLDAVARLEAGLAVVRKGGAG
jgi:NAD(P)H-dependent FMN reductase